MRLLFVATWKGGDAYAIEDHEGKLWLLTSQDRILKLAPIQTESGLRELLTHLCWTIQTAPPDLSQPLDVAH